MLQVPDMLEIEIVYMDFDPAIGETIETDTFSKVQDYEYESIRYIAYASDTDRAFEFEIDTDLDRIIKTTYTDIKGIDHNKEVERIKDVEKLGNW